MRRGWIILALAACGRVSFDEQSPGADATRADSAADAITTGPCAGVDTSGCTVVPCAATPACLFFCPRTLLPLANWSADSANCGARGGQLACASTPALMTCVQSMMTMEPVVIGLSQMNASATPADNWTWRCDGTAFGATWVGGEPNDFGNTSGVEDGEEDCAELYVDGFYNDIKCDDPTGPSDWLCTVP